MRKWHVPSRTVPFFFASLERIMRLFYPIAMNTAQHTHLFSAIVETGFGAIGVRTDSDRLHELVYLPSSFEEKAATNAVAERISLQVLKYLSDPDYRFELELPEVGTPFQQKVWGAISAIPRGSVLTYGEIACLIRSAPRAVGQACGANWFPLIVPCHRVTAAGGLGGFANDGSGSGFHAGVKRWLLQHEGVKAYL